MFVMKGRDPSGRRQTTVRRRARERKRARRPVSRMRWRGLEPPRPQWPPGPQPGASTNSATSAWGGDDSGRSVSAVAPGLARRREEAVEHDGVGRKQGGHHDRQPREVSLDDVRAALRGRREADAAEARVAARVHEHERDERGAEEHLEDGEDGDHRTRHGTGRYAVRMAAGDDARARIQRLLVTGDNRLKKGVDPEK